jgi:ABC-type uncharacterized transport system substrate-binding protein
MRKGLAEQDLIEGQSVSITYRWSAGDYRRLPEHAADLVKRNVDVIAASGLPAALAAKAASSTISAHSGHGHRADQCPLLRMKPASRWSCN